MRDRLSIKPEVTEALNRRRPVVALESTVIAHGLPYPRNIETARMLEAVVRVGGAMPATIAVLDGRIRVGLDDEDLERLASGTGIAKLSRRDLAVALATGADGATTVAASLFCAHLAGIAVFVTGGIGGVHRGAFEVGPGGADPSLDISADLEEVAQTDIAVVCAGAKAVLDLPRTLEYLETKGVPVLGLGTDEFPAFYVRGSGLRVSHRCDSPEAAARILRTKWQLGLKGGVIVANPIPADAELDSEAVDLAIAHALTEAAAEGVRGADTTPYLLRRLDKLTEGRSVDANVALLRHNAEVGTAIAVAYAQLLNDIALPLRVATPRLRA